MSMHAQVAWLGAAGALRRGLKAAQHIATLLSRLLLAAARCSCSLWSARGAATGPTSTCCGAMPSLPSPAEPPTAGGVLSGAVLPLPCLASGAGSHDHAITSAVTCEPCRRFPLVAIAPEATTKAQPCLLKFRRGAFAMGLPVCPVLLRYRYRHFNPGECLRLGRSFGAACLPCAAPSTGMHCAPRLTLAGGRNAGWGIAITPFHVYRLLAQLINHLDITVLPPYHPSGLCGRQLAQRSPACPRRSRQLRSGSTHRLVPRCACCS